MTVELPLAEDGRAAVDVARECAATAQELIRAAFGLSAVTVKGRRNVVTEADVAVELAVKRILADAYPDHVLLAEETADAEWSEGWMWVCDPIDGTKNFTRGIPHFAFSLALCYGGEPVLGLTTHPLLGWEFLAVAGQGCTANGLPCEVTELPLEGIVAAIDLGFDADRGLRQLAISREMWPRVEGIRTAGSAALGFAYLASGRWDLYLHAGLNPWDSAAGLVLVREAGGVVTEHDGSPATLRSTSVVAGSANAHAAFMALSATPGWPA